MNLLLSEPLPLRTTRMLGDFAVDAPLAHRFGDLTQTRFKLPRLTSTKFFAADHVMEITDAFIDDEKTLGWEVATEQDDKGHIWTVVNFAAAVPADAVASASGRGKRNPATNALLENPGEIMEYVARTICGRDDTFIDLRAECAAAAIVLAGSVDTVMPIRAQLDEIAYSAGAIWTPGASRLYPTSSIAPPVEELSKMEAAGLEPLATLIDTADVLRLTYDHDDATGKPAHYIELTASPQRFGGVVAERELKWVRTPANAEAIGRRMLERMAGERYAVAMNTSRVDLRPCAWIKLVAHPEWWRDGADPTLMVLAVDVTPDSAAAKISTEVLLSKPTITVTAHSVAVPSTTGAGIDVSYDRGVATFTITDKDSKPIVDARVSIDGGVAKRTDARGKVSFTVGRGKHKLAAEAPGYTPFEIEVVL